MCTLSPHPRCQQVTNRYGQVLANIKKKLQIFVGVFLVDFLNTEKDVYMLPFICELDSHPVMSFI